MHYIIGKHIRIAEYKQQPAAGVAVIGETVKRTKRVNATPFAPNIDYILTNIAVKGDTLTYTFRSSFGEEIHLPFDSSKQADKYISNILGEDLPDYEGFFRRSIG